MCNFPIFGLIFMKFLPKCKAKELGFKYTIFGSFCFFPIGKGPIFSPRSDLIGLRKSLILTKNDILLLTAPIAQLVQCPLLEREVMGSNPGHTIPKV